MQCRSDCGACCIAPSIREPYYGMPDGKPAGQVCVHLGDDRSCGLFDDPRRPKCCGQFQAELWVCGENREQALEILERLERETHGVYTE